MVVYEGPGQRRAGIVKGGQWFIEEPNHGAAKRESRKCRPALLPGRQHAAPVMTCARQTDAIQGRGQSRATNTKIADRREPAQVLKRTHVSAQAGLVAQISHRRGCFDTAALRVVEAREAAQQRTLAATVRPPDLDEVAFLNRQVKRAEESLSTRDTA